ncbi:unnamed protein product [Pleuronectes platessa]|uniref:Uncharacterized protein n=1 Tax=Pleuronectes platessa TaxID=8262 RepID=A0A9N7VVU9_PLEPL|nr:unnamed protein product [Pleuronectes platessa]
MAHSSATSISTSGERRQAARRRWEDRRSMARAAGSTIHMGLRRRKGGIRRAGNYGTTDDTDLGIHHVSASGVVTGMFRRAFIPSNEIWRRLRASSGRQLELRCANHYGYLLLQSLHHPSIHL